MGNHNHCSRCSRCYNCGQTSAIVDGLCGLCRKNDAIKFAFEALVVYSEVNKRKQQRSAQGQLAREALAKFKDVGIDKYYWG